MLGWTLGNKCMRMVFYMQPGFGALLWVSVLCFFLFLDET